MLLQVESAEIVVSGAQIGGDLQELFVFSRRAGKIALRLRGLRFRVELLNLRIVGSEGILRVDIRGESKYKQQKNGSGKNPRSVVAHGRGFSDEECVTLSESQRSCASFAFSGRPCFRYMGPSMHGRFAFWGASSVAFSSSDCACGISCRRAYAFPRSSCALGSCGAI